MSVVRVFKGRAASVLALLSLSFILAPLLPAGTWELLLEDGAGARIDPVVTVGDPARVVYRQEEPFEDAIAFQLFFRDEYGGWKLVSLVIEKPEAPALEVGSDLHTEDLSPGEYRIVLFRNDEEISKLLFSVSPPPAEE